VCGQGVINMRTVLGRPGRVQEIMHYPGQNTPWSCYKKC